MKRQLITRPQKMVSLEYLRELNARDVPGEIFNNSLAISYVYELPWYKIC